MTSCDCLHKGLVCAKLLLTSTKKYEFFPSYQITLIGSAHCNRKNKLIVTYSFEVYTEDRRHCVLLHRN